MDRLVSIRQEIENIDEEMIELFKRRMACSKEVAEYKIENGLPVSHPAREKDLIQKNVDKLGDEDLEEYYRDFFEEILTVSKAYQSKIMEA